MTTQIHACKELLKAKGIDDALIYEEQVSGRKAERTRLKKLLHDAAMNRFQVLTVFKLDRLTRGGIGEMFRIPKALHDYKVRVYSVSETWYDPDAPTTELILAVIAWAASFESKSIGERVSAGIASKKAEAKAKGEKWRWGQARVSKWVNDPTYLDRAAQLRSEGLSYTQLANELGVSRTTARRLCLLASQKNSTDSMERSEA